MSRNKITRRQFLGTASCAAVGTTTLLSSILNLGAVNALSAKALRMPARPLLTGNYKSMVCILLGGGNDSYNMLVPRTAEQYNIYATSRSNLAIPQNDLLPLNFTDNNGYEYGLNPAMTEVQELFNSGKLAFVANVGTLVEPTAKSQIVDGTANLPLGLLSHSDQAYQWQTSVPQARSAKGWGGRLADILMTLNENQNVSMNISLSGTNAFQVGNQVIEFAIQNFGAGSVGIQTFDFDDPFNQLLSSGINNIFNQTYADIFKQTYRDKILNAQSTHEAFSAAILAVPPFGTPFSDNGLSQSLQMIAKSIAARETLGQDRQIYFVSFNGWDHHDELTNNHAAMLGTLSAALNEFQSALEELNVADCVTTFTISDFARNLISNGNGTDHAWGGHCLVMGDSVNGGQIYGSYPQLDLGGPLELGGGILLPTLSTDQYFAELALWFGLETSDFPYVFPNLLNFHNINDGQPLGFMNI